MPALGWRGCIQVRCGGCTGSVRYCSGKASVPVSIREKEDGTHSLTPSMISISPPLGQFAPTLQNAGQTPLP